LSQDGRQATRKGVELHKPQARKRTALSNNARLGKTGTLRGRLLGGIYFAERTITGWTALTPCCLCAGQFKCREMI